MDDARGRYIREMTPYPVNQRFDAIGADVAVKTVKLGSARNSETIQAKATCDDLGAIVE